MVNNCKPELPLVSICIPAYNAERFISDTLESALRQDYSHLEILVSDDGSTDRTLELVQAYQSRGVRVIRQDNNLGMTRNMNAVIFASAGKYAVKLDSDDLLEPGYVSRLVPVLEAHPSVAFAHCACRLIDVDGKFLGYERSIHGSFIRSGLEEWPRYVLGPRAVHILMLRREAFDAVGGYNDSFIRSQDWKLERDLLCVGDVYYCDQVLAHYRSHAEGKKDLHLLRAQAFLLHMEDMDRHWPKEVPNKEHLLGSARRRFALGLALAASSLELAESQELLKIFAPYQNYLPVRLITMIIKAGGSGIIHKTYACYLRLRQMVKEILYKEPAPVNKA
jgi:glycosyltransferase involved in cell wall biosynthesis